MDGPLLMFLFIVGVVFLAAPILAVIALARASRLQGLAHEVQQNSRHLAALKDELWQLRQRLDEMAKQAGAIAPPSAAGAGIAEPVPAVAVPVRRPAAPPAPPAPIPPVWPETASAPARAAASTRFSSAVSVDWERWLGIRGAAVLGAVALGLAGLLFFKYSIEHAWITPAMRVVLGTLTGLGCLAASEGLRARGYRFTAEGIGGAGILILYSAFWAAHVLYALIGMVPAFALMILVTVTCCLLAARRQALTIAVLGLVGGFATPLLLASGSDRPLGLFGYVLLLDLGLLTLGHRRRWPSLGLLSLLFTVALQTLWVGARMGPERVFLAIIILAVFAALFTLSGRLAADGEERGWWRWSQIGAVLFPFAFAIYFAGRVELGPRIYPIAILLAILGVAAVWIARQQIRPAIGTGAAAASVAVVAVWLIQHRLTLSLAWETMAVIVGLSAIFHLFEQRPGGKPGRDGPAPATLVALGGFFVVSLPAAARATVAPWPWLVGWACLMGLIYWQTLRSGQGTLQSGGAIALAGGLSLLHLSSRPVLPPASLFLAVLVAAPVTIYGVALLLARSPLRGPAAQAAAILPVILLLGLVPSEFTVSLGPLAALGVSLLLGILALLAATRLGKGTWYAAAVCATALVHTLWTWSRPGLDGDLAESFTALALGLLAVVLFTAWPLATVRSFSSDRLAWYAAALAGPLWFWSLRHLFTWRFGDAFIGVLPVALGALTLAAAARSRTALPQVKGLRLTALVWFAAVALCFVAVAIPLQLEKEWVTIGWALQGMAVVGLWRRLDHPGLKYFGLLLLAGAAIRLVGNPALLGYHAHSSWRIVNWLLYTYLVPAAAMLGAALFLRTSEVQRARAWESGLYARGHAMGAMGSGVAAIAVIFIWINLAVADWFTVGDALTLSFGDRPAQRLTVSLAWAAYALVLLGLGISRNWHGLRWLSLAFLLVTIAKVFLYDLGALTDLYRVASLVGLAASLIMVSLLYQRFVFREGRPKGT